jgi:hypothetical protein
MTLNKEPKQNDIIYNSWGYDQTNIDFYKVISTNGKTLKLKQLENDTIETGFIWIESHQVSM